MIRYFFKNAFIALKYNKFRTLLTGLGIFVGVASVIIIISFSESFSHHLINEFSENITIGLVSNVGYDTDFSEVMLDSEIQAAIEEIRNIEGVSSFKQAEGSKTVDCQMEDSTWQYGVNIAFDDTVAVTEGCAFEETSGNVVIAYADEDSEIENVYEIGDKLIVDSIVYSVVGLTNDLSAVLYFPERLCNQVLYEEVLEIAAFYLTINQENEEIVDMVLDILNEPLENGIQFINYSSSNSETISEVFSTITIFLSLIASVSLIVSAINIINIMYISILERKQEIAVYRSLGMSKKMVVYIFLIESILIVFLFSILGYVFGMLIAGIILTVINVSIYVSITGLLLILAMSVILGIGAGIKPALKAANTNLSILLR